MLVDELCDFVIGKMHNKVWIATGNIILVGVGDYQDNKADVILKYMPDEVTPLKSYGRCRRVLGLTNVLLVVSITRMRELVMLTSSLRMRIWIKSRFCQLE